MYKNDLYLKSIKNVIAESGSSSPFAYNNYILTQAGFINKTIISIFNILSPLIYLLNILASFLFFICKFFVCSLNRFFKKKSLFIQENTLYLFFTGQFRSKVIASNLYLESRVWVIGGLIDYSSFDLSDKIVVDCRDNLTVWDYIKVLCHSMNTLLGYLIKERTIFTIYKIWNFYECSIALRKISHNKEIVFSNQLDRWALLFDDLPASKKTLLQHGLMPINVPNKLKNVDVMYSMTKETWKDALINVLDCTPEIKYMSSTIKLSEINTDKPSILIIAHILHFEVEKKIIRNLQKYEADIYVKKHPGVNNDRCYYDLQKEYGFTYLTEPIFPKVNFLISYNSTLVYEYQNFGIPFYKYENVDDFSMNILEEALMKNNIKLKKLA